MNLNLFSIAGLVLSSTCFILVFIILVYGKTKLHRIWALFNIAVGIWGVGSFFIGKTTSPVTALLLWRFAHIGIILIPVFIFHVVYIICELRQRIFLYLIYFQGILFLFLDIFTNFFIPNVRYFSSSFYYGIPGPSYYLFLIIWIAIIFYIHYRLFLTYIISKGTKRNQILYLFLGTVVGFSGGITNFLPAYKIDLYPVGNFTIPLYCFIVSYAILKYRLMDIRVAVTRAGVFIIVYTFVLGIPLYLGYRYGLWIYSTWLTIFLASAGPFLFIYLQRRAEEVVFKEQRHYQESINNLSKSMIDIRDLDVLLDTITLTITEAVKIDSARIYIKDNEYKSFRLRSCNPQEAKSRFEELIPFEHSLVDILRKQEKPLLSEEAGPQDKISLDSGLIIPCFSKDGLIAIIVLGSKPDKQMYTPDDLLVFENLSYAASLAIENCDYFKQIEEQQRQSRVKEMDMFSYSLAHEIFNPMYVITGEVESLQKYFLKYITDPGDYKEAENACKFALEASHRVSGMVEAIQEFGKKSTGEFSALKLEDVLESFLKLYMPLFKTQGIFFAKELPKEIPFIRGSKQELAEVLVIFSNNAIHALLGTQDKEKHIDLKVKVYNSDRIRISLSDNGYGIAKEKLHSIFAPFVTTKASTEGTGMGLYTAKRIVERHNGKIWAESEGKGKGAAFFVELPIAKDVTEEDLKKEDKGKILFKNT